MGHGEKLTPRVNILPEHYICGLFGGFPIFENLVLECANTYPFTICFAKNDLICGNKR